METEGLDAVSKRHLRSCESQSQCKYLPLGLWGDGVPCNWDRTESVDTIAISLPGQTGQFKPLRMPVLIMRHAQVSEHTWEDAMEIIAWSLQCCAAGVFPRERHDGSDWLKSDRTRCKRCKNAGESLGIRSILTEVRGDWNFYAETFGFSRWNTGTGLCFRCKCTLDEARSQ